MNQCLVLHPGEMPYTDAWELQKRLHAQVVEGKLPNLLLMLQHPHVYTLGRRGQQEHILISPDRLEELGAEVQNTDRGGEVTYHGPGQLIGYPIINLRQWGGGPLKYVRSLEKTITATLAEFGIVSDSQDRPTGVWVGDAKIAAIGVKISRRVTMHGFALNVNPDLTYFDHIVPCGMPDAPVTSMSRQLSKDIAIDEVIPVLQKAFGKEFGMSVEVGTVEDIVNNFKHKIEIKN